MKSTTLLGLALTILVPTPLTVRSSEIWGKGGLASFCDTLRSPDVGVLKLTFKGYLPVLERMEGFDLGQIKIATSKDISPLLSRLVQLGSGPLELFSDVEFARGSCVLLLDQKTLLEVDDKFDIHGLWMIRAPIEGQERENVVMEFLVLGQGKLIVGYPRQATVKVKDYDLYTGKYTYEPFMSMDIIHDRGGRGLFNIKSLDTPNGEFQSFRGPLDARIYSLQVDGAYVRVRYAWGTDREDRIPKIPITLR